MRTVFLALGLFIASTLPALAASPHNTYTHNTAFAVPEQSYQLAATWFLPDWQAGLASRTDIAPDNSGDRHDLTCSVYGGCLGIPANTTCSDDFTVDGKTCYKSCSCKSGFVPASSSDICKGCVNPCDAHTAVDAPYGCEKYFSDCASKCEKAYADNCRNRTAVSEGSYGCKTYFADCPSKCQTAYTDNCHIRTAVSTPYGCEKYFDDCKSKCEKAYPDNCRNYSSKPAASSCANGCAQGKTYADCSSKCSVGCKAKCDTGYHLSSDELSCVADSCPGGYEAGKTCGAGYKRLQSGQSGTTPCYKCEITPCTAGSTSCSGATVAKENGYYSGENKCYTCQTCEQAGKKTCNGACIAASECCGCTSSQKCVSGSCVAKTCADAGGPVCPAGQKCQNGTCVQDKTPLEICQDKILERDPKAVFVSTAGELVDAIAAAKNAYLMKDINGSTTSFTKTMEIRDLTSYANSISECSGQPARTLNLTSPSVSGAVDFYVNVKITSTLSVSGSSSFHKLLTAKAINTTQRGMLYIYGCNSSVGQYTSTSKNAVLELHGSSPKNCTFDIQFITINSSGVLTLMITDGTLKNSGGVSDGSQYSTPFSAYLTNAVWELSNRGQMCFIGAQAGWSIDIRRSCFKTYGSEIYNCSSNAYLQTLTYQYDQYWNGECMQYCMSGGGYEDDCISGTQYINTYYSFPY